MKNATLVFLRSKIKNISYFCSLKNVFVFLFYGEHIIIFYLYFSLVMEKKGIFYSLILVWSSINITFISMVYTITWIIHSDRKQTIEGYKEDSDKKQFNQ